MRFNTFRDCLSYIYLTTILKSRWTGPHNFQLIGAYKNYDGFVEAASKLHFSVQCL